MINEVKDKKELSVQVIQRTKDRQADNVKEGQTASAQGTVEVQL